MREPFKICPHCSHTWPSRAAILQDEALELIGYQANFLEIATGLFLFNHTTCKTTLAIPACLFENLYDGPVFEVRKTGQEDCPGYCLRVSELSACPAQCECAWVRSVLQIIRRWPKAGMKSAAAG